MRAASSFLVLVLGCSTGLASACGGGGSGGGAFEAPPGADGGGHGDGGVSPSGDSGPPSFGGDGGGGTVASLVFDPPSATLQSDGATPQTASFTLKAKLQGGGEVTVTPESVAFDRPDLAAMTVGSPVVLTASGQVGGAGTLQGVYKGQVAKAKLEVSVHVQALGTGVTPAAAAALDGATAQDPLVKALLYPYDATVLPLGITSPLVMWDAPKAGDVYRLHLAQKDYVVDDYEVVQTPAQLRLAQAAWDKLTASNQGDPLAVTLSRWDAQAQTAAVSAKQSWTIAPASLRGAIYYWTTSAGGHMSRIRPGTGAQPEVLNGGKCMGCHAVSADGSTLVAAVEGAGGTSQSPPGPNQAKDQGDGRPWVSFALPGVSAVKQSGVFAGNVAVNPDGKYVVFGDQRLYLADAASGQVKTGTGLDDFALDPGMSGLMTPAFSPDGKHLVAVEGAGTWYHNLMNGKLVLFDFDEATQTFTNPKGLAAASLFPAAQHAMAYPTFSPDAKWVAFHVGDYDTGCDAQGCDASATQLGAIYLQSTAGAAPPPPVRLDALTDSSPKAGDHDLSFEPTFNPVQRGGYFWVVVSSSRDWGNRITGTPNNGKKRLWVAAIDASATPGATDPSHPAFFLEGQEEATENMRGFWALAACTPTAGGGGCQAGFECCSGFCDKGQCVDTGTIACQGVGGTCSADADCCNAPYVHCVGGSCQPTTQ